MRFMSKGLQYQFCLGTSKSHIKGVSSENPCRSSCDPYLFYDVTESVSDVAFTGQA